MEKKYVDKNLFFETDVETGQELQELGKRIWDKCIELFTSGILIILINSVERITI